MSFYKGQRVWIVPGSFHTEWANMHTPATFVRYMAGGEYSIVYMLEDQIRVRTEDLVDLDED